MFQGKGTSKKKIILQNWKYWKRYIQNPGLFRPRSIFRILVYLEPEAYPEHCHTSTIERFAKIAT